MHVQSYSEIIFSTMWNYSQNETQREVYNRTQVLRKPISGIVSGYHQLPYILIAPDDQNPSHTVEVHGKINVSPKFVITPGTLQETFGDVFDPETFDSELQGRLFSFAYSGRSNLKLESEYFRITTFEHKPEEHLDRITDELCQQENTRTGLIYGPRFQYYPISIDRFVTELLDREFRV